MESLKCYHLVTHQGLVMAGTAAITWLAWSCTLRTAVSGLTIPMRWRTTKSCLGLVEIGGWLGDWNCWKAPSLFEKIWVVQPERLDDDDGEPSPVTPTSFPRVESTTSRRLPQWQRGPVLRLVDGDRDASAGMFLWGLSQGIDRPPEMGVSGNEIYCTGVYP